MNAPFSWPKSSEAISDTGRAAQLTATRARRARRERRWMARATSSLPVPVSPVISTVVSVAATLSTSARVSRRASEVPMISSNIERSSISWRSARFSAWSWPVRRAISSKARALATAAAIGRASAAKTSTSCGENGPGTLREKAREPTTRSRIRSGTRT